MFDIIIWKDIIDILFVAAILYGGFYLLRKSGAANLFWGILAFVLLWLLVSYVLHLELVGAIMDQIVSVGAIALIVIFQNEIRSFFYRVGGKLSSSSVFSRRTHQQQVVDRAMDQLVKACHHMSESHTGALIILTGHQDLHEFTSTGEKVDAMVSARMIENIFFKNTPLHDGALFITNGRLDSAACILPVSHNSNLPQHYGLRHRAALGLTEKTDAIAIVVSEETGAISVARGNEIQLVPINALASYLTQSK